MTTVRRLQAAAAFSAAIFAATCWHASGTAATRNRPGVANSESPKGARELTSGPHDPSGIFANRPILTYATASGETFFALQVQPKLGETVVRPRDMVVVVDTSASQAGVPLQNARLLIEEIVKKSGPDDRLAIWTANTPADTKDLTRGFQPASDPKVFDALLTLEKTVYAAGATDLKGGLNRIIGGLNPVDGRRTAIVYIGDGESVLDPLNDADRAKIAADSIERQTPIFTVPVGVTLNAKNLHGLANATGGLVIRLNGSDKPNEAAARLVTSIDAPVFYPTKTEFSESVAEALPNRLPPLRPDSSTLVAGQLKGKGAIVCKLEGQVAGKATSLTINEAAPAPEYTNYFLINLVKQWHAADQSAPALMRADRGLALAYEQTRLARDEFLSQAQWAVGLNKLDAAMELYKAAKAIDPGDPESATGLSVVGKIQSGEINRAEFLRTGNMAAQTDFVRPPASTTTTAVVQPAVVTQAEPAGGASLLDLEKRRRGVQEQQVTQAVDETVRQARKLVMSAPEQAYDLLKRQLESIRDNGDLSEGVRATLANRLESALRTAKAEGAKVLLEQETALRSKLAAEVRRGVEAGRASEDEKIRERVRIFGTLMDRARYEEGYKESLALHYELQEKGRPTPPAVQIGYQMSLNADYIRKYETLRRENENKRLLTMFQVDKSHVPFADEPPVAFPASEVWRKMTSDRKDRYETESLGGFSRKTIELKEKLTKPANIDRTFDNPLRDVIDYLADKLELTVIINQSAFKAEGQDKADEQPIKIGKLPGVSLSTYLSFVLSQVNGTYTIKRDYIEVTTRKAAALDKIIRAYPVADLVIPIPNAVDPQSLQQNLQVLGGSLSANGQAIFGSAGGGLNFGNFGGGGGFGQFGQGGGFGAGGGILGGGGGGQQAFLGGGAQGQQGGALGFGGGTSNTNMGFGGGVTGFGGGQQGQFGNLGGQFGLQGGDTSYLLIDLIQNIIAPKEWNTRASQILAQASLIREEDDPPSMDISLLNALQYYQPARALVVRGSSKVHTKTGDFTPPPGQNMGKGPFDPRGGDVIVFDGKAKKNNPTVVVAAPKAPAPAKPEVVKAPHDSKKAFQDLMAQGKLRARNVIAMSDLLAMCHKFDEAAELLKADLRHGLLAHPCCFDALAVALEGSQASSEEIERVRLSKIDLAPQSPTAFIETAQAMQDRNLTDKALEFYKRAAALEPNSADAYHKALVMAPKAGSTSTDAIEWAASNLLSREWESDGSTYHQQAKATLERVAQQLATQGRTTDAGRIRSIFGDCRERDLVIEATCTDPADLDLSVAEPIGTVCSLKQQRTPAGGALTADRLGTNAESYVAAQAFNGSYEITINRVWGQPMGNKATVTVTRHQGTPKESVERHTVTFDAKGKAMLKVAMLDGRRTTSESVPVANLARRAAVEAPDRGDVYAALRSMADPTLGAIRPSTKTGTSAGASVNDSSRTGSLAYETGVELSHQTKVSPALSSGIDLLTSTTISPDRKSMKLTFNPGFDGLHVNAQVPLAAVPGGR